MDMTFEEKLLAASPYLLRWIDLSIAPKSLTVPYDLKKVKRLEGRKFPGFVNGGKKNKSSLIEDFLTSGKKDWSLLGEMTNLQVLEFPSRMPSGLIGDFSFLPKLTSLQRLDLKSTGFTDCSLLSGLNQLKYLILPARKKLLHGEVLDALSCSVSTDEPFYQEDTFPSYKILLPQECDMPVSGGFAIRYLDYGRVNCTNGEITQAVVDKLIKKVRKGDVNSLCLSLDESGEEDFFTMDLENGWAAPMFNVWGEDGEAICFQPINDKYNSVEEDAPVEIGGQSPVPKRFALDDLNLAAECVAYFAKTGKLYPGISWAEFS